MWALQCKYINTNGLSSDSTEAVYKKKGNPKSKIVGFYKELIDLTSVFLS